MKSFRDEMREKAESACDAFVTELANSNRFTERELTTHKAVTLKATLFGAQAALESELVKAMAEALEVYEMGVRPGWSIREQVYQALDAYRTAVKGDGE